MSHNQDLSALDLIVVLLLALGLGALAHLSSVPERAATPGANWPEAPTVSERLAEKAGENPIAEPSQESMTSEETAEEPVEVEAEEESWE